MSENKKSFWASIPGLVTGLAGLLTGLVGLVTVLIQLDVIGGDDSSSTTAVGGPTTTVAGRAPAPGAAATTTTAVSGRLTTEPVTLKLNNEREKALTVRNSSSTAVTVLKPEYTGADSRSFSTDGGCTNVFLRPGSSCTVKVTLTPSGTLRTYKATLVLEARELSQVTEVPVEATTIL
jgi:hypothetical protein